MKTIISLTLLFCASGLAFAQSDSTHAGRNTEERVTLIHAQRARASKDNISILEQDVLIEVGKKLKLEADSVVFDRKNNIITAYKTKSFRFDGEVIISKVPNGICRYAVGADVLFLE